MNIYIAQDGHTVGPYSESEIRHRLEARLFSLDDLACVAGEVDWRPLSEILPPVPAPTPAAPAPVSPVAPTPDSPRPAAKPPSLLPVFLTVLGAIVLGGTVLLAGWKFFTRDRGSKPDVAAASEAKSPLRSTGAKGRLQGEVIVNAPDGQRYKLNGVEIAAYPLETLQAYLAERKKFRSAETDRLEPLVKQAQNELTRQKNAVDTAKQEWLGSIGTDAESARKERYTKTSSDKAEASIEYDKLHAQYNYLLTGAFFFDRLPTPEVVTRTNPDGNFNLVIPTEGKFAVAALAKLTMGDQVEKYYWMLKASLDGASQKTLQFSSSNLSTQYSGESLILTSGD